MILLLFILLLILYALFLLKRSVNKKYFILFLVNPILYLLYPHLLQYLQNIKKRIQNGIERRKQIKEIPKLIEYLKSYIKSGVQPSQAIKIISKKRKWSSPIQNSLSQMTNYYSQGMSFESSIHIVISSISKNKYNHFLLFFLSSLRIGYMSGGNMVSILEKVKNKIENSIFLDQKIHATTAQIRLQAIIISLAPLALASIIWFISPSYILFFFDNKVGNFLFAFMLLLNVVGFYLLKLISRLN
jgi:tight adherence protein B